MPQSVLMPSTVALREADQENRPHGHVDQADPAHGHERGECGGQSRGRELQGRRREDSRCSKGESRSERGAQLDVEGTGDPRETADGAAFVEVQS